MQKQSSGRPTLKLMAVSLTFALAGCQGGPNDNGGGGGGGTVYDLGGTGGYVSSFSAAQLEAARVLREESTRYTNQIWRNALGLAVTTYGVVAARAEYAHALDLKGAGQLISIRDNGFNPDHDEFTGKTLVIDAGASVTQEDHGTGVASIAAGSDETGDRVGVAPDASLHLSSWSDESNVTAITRARELGAIVQNNSWGINCLGISYDTDGDGECEVDEMNLSQVDAFLGLEYINGLQAYAGDVGIIVFAASNNSGQDHSTLMASLPSFYSDLEEGWLTVINVARDYNESTGDFDDGAGDLQLISTGCFEAARWCIAADGSTIVATAASDSSYGYGTGTSYAAPIVSGAVAILAEAFPTLTPAQLRNRLLATADNSFFVGEVGRNIQTMTFSGGITHDYDEIYGHGFIDLRAALLPIGAAIAAAANGASVEIGQVALVSGGPSGDAVSTALAGRTIMAVDSLEGEFSVSAAAISAEYNSGEQSALELNQMMQSDMHSIRAERYALTQGLSSANAMGLIGESDPVFDLYEGYRMEFDHENLTFSLMLPSEVGNSFGGGVAFETGGDKTRLNFGMTVAFNQGSVVGVSVPGDEDSLYSQTLGFGVGLARTLGPRSTLRLNAGWGAAIANGAGIVDSFETITFSNVAMAFDRGDVFRNGDVLTFFLRQPTRINSGSMNTSLSTGRDAGGSLTFEEFAIGLSPENRQVDIGFDYRTEVWENAELMMGVYHSLNSGNITASEDTHALLGLQYRF